MARESTMMSMKRTILINDVKYSNLLVKLVLAFPFSCKRWGKLLPRHVSNIHMSLRSWRTTLWKDVPGKDCVGHDEDDTGCNQKNGDYLHRQNVLYSVDGGSSLLLRPGILTGCGLGEVSTCPKLDEDIEESGFRSYDGGPTYTRVNYMLKICANASYPAILRSQLQKPGLDRPIDLRNRYSYQKLEKQLSFRRETAGQPRRKCRPRSRR